MQNMLYDNDATNKSKYLNEDMQFNPKKCMLMNYFFKACEIKAEQKDNNNKHISLVENNEIEEEEENEMKFNNN